MPVREASPIDDFVHELGGRLRGPGRFTTDLLTEVRDGLTDAAEGYRSDGLPAGTAELAAITEFGSVRLLAADFQAELAARAVRSLALRIVIVTAVLLAAGDLTWRGAPWAGTTPPAGYHLVSVSINWLWGASGLVALLCLGRLLLDARRGRTSSARLTRLAGYGMTGALTVSWLGGTVLWAWSVHIWPGAFTWPPMLVGAGVLAVAYGWLASGACTCVLSTRWPG